MSSYVPAPPRISEGAAGTFYPASGEPETAAVTKVWSDTCVNLNTASGAQPTSVLVVYDGTPAELTPGCLYFVPSDASLNAGPPPTDPV